MHVTVDRHRCTAIGLCESDAPEVFRLDDDGELNVAENIAETSESNVRRAVSDCPMKALRFT